MIAEYIEVEGEDESVKGNGDFGVVQCKCYQNKVGSSEYYETHAARDNYSAGEAILLTNNYFTSQVVDMAADNNIHL